MPGQEDTPTFQKGDEKFAYKGLEKFAYPLGQFFAIVIFTLLALVILRYSDIWWRLWDHYTSWLENHEVQSFFVVGLPLAIAACSAISERHARELYLLWYIFFFFFLLFFALNLAARWTDQELNAFLGEFAFVYGWLTNPVDELLFAGAVFYLGIGPQLLTYFVSGISGCASSPIFVRQIQRVAILSLVKFQVGLSGITLAAVCADLSFGKAASRRFALGTWSVELCLRSCCFPFLWVRLVREHLCDSSHTNHFELLLVDIAMVVKMHPTRRSRC
jgi:hypothetical protein